MMRNKRMQSLIDECRRLELAVELLPRRGSGHYQARITAPDGAKHILTVAATPSCWRARRNQMALLRRWSRDYHYRMENRK
jgi:hypothetical protein